MRARNCRAHRALRPHLRLRKLRPSLRQKRSPNAAKSGFFSDLVGSTALSARMDPNDLREIISIYQKCVAATVDRFGGFIAKYMGDEVLVYFGYPQAHEHDAKRAILTTARTV